MLPEPNTRDTRPERGVDVEEITIARLEKQLADVVKRTDEEVARLREIITELRARRSYTQENLDKLLVAWKNLAQVMGNLEQARAGLVEAHEANGARRAIRVCVKELEEVRDR